jgi:hypothetical protein
LHASAQIIRGEGEGAARDMMLLELQQDGLEAYRRKMDILRINGLVALALVELAVNNEISLERRRKKPGKS